MKNKIYKFYTRTIPTENEQCNNNDCNSDNRFGMNEDYEYYQNCRYRSRNKGLFTIDQVYKLIIYQFLDNLRLSTLF